MLGVSPVSTNTGASQNQEHESQQDQKSNSIAPSIESLPKRQVSLRVLHPNAPIPGRWWGSQNHEKCSKRWSNHAKENQIPFSMRHGSLTHVNEESSMDEYFETKDTLERISLTDHFLEYNPMSAALEDFDPEVKPHMTEPLLPDGSPLNLFAIRQYCGETNVYSATPLARVWEFNTEADEHEYSILNILADEFENIDEKQGELKRSLWSQFKKLTIGLSEEEYNEQYPWAKYCIRNLLVSEEMSPDQDS